MGRGTSWDADEAAWDQATKEIPASDWVHNTKGDLTETLSGQTYRDEGGTAKIFTDNTESYGRAPAADRVPKRNASGDYQINEYLSNDSFGHANFRNAAGDQLPYGGEFNMFEFDEEEDIYGEKKRHGFGSFQSGQFNFRRGADGQKDWNMTGPYGSNPVSREFVDQTYGNQLQKFGNMTGYDQNSQTFASQTPQDKWEAGHPTAVGDEMGDQFSGATNEWDSEWWKGSDTNPVQMGEVYAESNDAYLDKRADMNNPSNTQFPTGTGGTGEQGWFGRLKDFLPFGKGRQ